MKTSREQLKALMKELLVEILSEGLGNARSVQSVNKTQIVGESVVRSNVNPRRKTFDPSLDIPVKNSTSHQTDFLKESIRMTAGGNSCMADILADTAMTTLPTQLAHGDQVGQQSTNGSASPGNGQEQFDGDPTEVFGLGPPRSDGSSHWADLAFMPAKKLA